MAKGKKIVHVFMADTKTTYGIMSQLHKRDKGEYSFLILDKESCVERFPKLKEFNDLIFLPEGNICTEYIFFHRMLSSASIVVWHSLFFGQMRYLYYIYTFRHILKKSIWVEWGADLYLWEYKNDSIEHCILNHVNRSIRKRIRYCGVTFPIDKEFLQRQFGKRKRCFDSPMPNPRKGADELIQYIFESQPDDLESSEKIVLVSHNAFTFNNHMYLFRILEKFRLENVKFLIPINYGQYGINGQFGGTSYCNMIEKYAQYFFGNRAIVLKESIPFDEYVKVLWRVDVAVFDFDRPCGLGTLRMLALMGKKIYLPAGSEYFSFLKEKGINVYDTKLINSLSFEEFVEHAKPSNLDWIYDYLNNDCCMEKWEKMLNEVRRKNK